MPPPLNSAKALAASLVSVAALALLPVPAAFGADHTVTISGRAYAFNHMDTYLAGATIMVRERPRLAAVTDANGDYRLEVPDDANVTPYIDPPPGYNQIDLQTFHTRGADIENANFQTPADAEYGALAGLLSVRLGADGRPEQCVIVTTSSARNVRGVDYETFRARTPHGVAGATSATVPGVAGPIYFNEFVIPDKTRTATSGDGGIIWTEVPAGTYRVITESPTTRFAGFLASCEPGRIVNANPPWGAYELSPGERALGAGVVAASARPLVVRKAGPRQRRRVVVAVDSAEPVRVNAVLRRAGTRVGHARVDLEAGAGIVSFAVRRAARRGRAWLDLRLRDAGLGWVERRHRVRLPGSR